MPTVGLISLITLWTALASGGLALSVLLTTPASIGPIGVTIWFVAFLTAVSGALTLALYGTKTYLHLHGTAQHRLRYSGRQALLLGGWATAMIALSTLQQLNLRDALLLGLILLVVELYARLRQP